MENYKVVRTIIKNHPDILNNRQKLRSTLLDYFPNEKLSVNMFLMAYDEGLLSKIENLNLVDELMFQGFVNTLTADYGVTYETAHNVVKMAAGTLDKLVQEPEMPVAPDTTVSPVFPEKKSKAPVKKPTTAAPSSAKDFRYASNGKEVRINKYIGKGGLVVIPDFIDGLPVTRIAENAFCPYNNKNAERITGLQLPSQLEYIGSDAFQGIENLTGVLVLPTTLKKVDSHAFQSTGLKGLVVQSSCSLELNSFANIYGMEFIYVAKGCAPIIDTSVFSYAEALQDLVLPKEISDIAEETFDGCNDAVLYAPKNSYAAKYGQKNFMCVNTDQYEKMSDYYKNTYSTI